MQRSAAALWTGSIKEGQGTISTDSGVLAATPYSFATRFDDGKGTNPEELIAAAHAGCFAMALSAELGKLGQTAERIQTSADVTLEKTDAGFTITAVHLKVKGKVPNWDPASFKAAAENAKNNCPISRLLNAQITLEARLEGWT